MLHFWSTTSFHYIDNGTFLTSYILSTVSTCTMILLNILNTNNFQFIHNGTYFSIEILSTVSTYTIILLYMCSTTFSSSTIWYLFYLKYEILSTDSTSTNILPLPLIFDVSPHYLWNTSDFQYHHKNTSTFSLPLKYSQLYGHREWYYLSSDVLTTVCTSTMVLVLYLPLKY